MLIVVGLWCAVAIGRMDPLSIIKNPDVLENCRFRLIASFEMLAIQPLLLDAAPETFHRSVIPAVALAAHAADKAVRLGHLLVLA